MSPDTVSEVPDRGFVELSEPDEADDVIGGGGLAIIYFGTEDIAAKYGVNAIPIAVIARDGAEIGRAASLDEVLAAISAST